MPSKVQVTGGGFQDAEGAPLANGYLELYLDRDNSVTGVGNLCAGIKIRIQLDSVGNAASDASTPVATNQFVWGNDVMLSPNAFYRVTGYTEAAQPAWGPNNQQIFGDGGTFDLGTWVPNQVISWTPPVQPLRLEVDGTPNEDQALLNLISSPTVVFSDDGNGNIEADLNWFGGDAPFAGDGSPILLNFGAPFPTANDYYVLVQYANTLVNPGILSVENVSGSQAKIHSTSGTDASRVRYFVLQIST